MDRNIYTPGEKTGMVLVALLAEGVDRNMEYYEKLHEKYRSPSSRRAWIEIAVLVVPGVVRCVALLAEGVDRNWYFRAVFLRLSSRPPRGGRG